MCVRLILRDMRHLENKPSGFGLENSGQLTTVRRSGGSDCGWSPKNKTN